MENDYTVLVDYPNDWSIVTDDEHSFVAVAHKGEPTNFINVYVPDDDEALYTEIMNTLIGGTIVTTDYLTGYAVELGEWDEWGEYPVHVVYATTESPDDVNIASAPTLSDALDALQAYTGTPEDGDVRDAESN